MTIRSPSTWITAAGRVDLVAELGDPPVHGDPPGRDQLLAGPPGADAGGGQHLLQAFGPPGGAGSVVRRGVRTGAAPDRGRSAHEELAGVRAGALPVPVAVR